MGFESRDYFRDGSYTDSLSGWGVDFTPVVKYLIIANVVVFLLQILLTRPAVRQLPDFDEIGPDEEEIAAEHPAGKNDETKTVDRQKREKMPARPARRWKRC